MARGGIDPFAYEGLKALCIPGMPLPTTTLAIYDLLANDPELASLLGVHTLAGGTTRPAICHFFSTEAIEPTTIPKGVEVVVWRNAIGNDVELAQTGEVYVNPTFRLTITQWEPVSPTGAYHVGAVLDRLQALLPGANANDVTVDGLTTGLSQYVLIWRCPVAVLWT